MEYADTQYSNMDINYTVLVIWQNDVKNVIMGIVETCAYFGECGKKKFP
jgi:hypothetical protein